jgi:methionyl-tRNA formyltransferase
VSNLKGKRILLAGYGLPAEYGLAVLFGLGANPSDVLLFTEPPDARNKGLVAAAEVRNVTFSISPATTEVACLTARKFSPDMILSLHYRRRIPRNLLDLPRLGAVNLHPSLLPRYRGVYAVPWTIIQGERKTGFSFHYMDETFDTGRLLLQGELDIAPDETAFSLFHRQIAAALPMLPSVLDMVLQRAPGRAQEGQASYFERRLPYDGRIDPSWPDDLVDRFIRAMYFPPFEPALLERDGHIFKIRTMSDYHAAVQARAGARGT